MTTPTLPLADTSPPIDALTTVYGWGYTCLDACESTVLKSATMRVTSFEIPLDQYSGPAITSYGVGGHPWRGDSGGPQVYNGAQVGVASNGDGRGRGVYGNVAGARPWITTTTGI